MYFIYEILDKTHFGRLVNAIKWNFTGFNSDRTQQFSATWCYNMTFNNSFFSRTLSIFLQGANMMQISFKFYYSVLKASLLWECIIYTHIFEYLQRTGFFFTKCFTKCVAIWWKDFAVIQLHNKDQTRRPRVRGNIHHWVWYSN